MKNCPDERTESHCMVQDKEHLPRVIGKSLLKCQREESWKTTYIPYACAS